MPSSESSPLDGIPPNVPFKLSRTSIQDPTWEQVITALLKNGHIWEANTLLAIYLRHARPTEPKLLRILDAVPHENDTMYDLVRLTMLVSCSRSLLNQGTPFFETTAVYGRCLKTAEDLQSSAMDGITDPVASSRAYQEFTLLRLELSKTRGDWDQSNSRNFGKSDVSRGIQATRERALENSDHMLFLASYEQDIDSLPDHWMNKTGASREATACLHPCANVAQRLGKTTRR